MAHALSRSASRAEAAGSPETAPVKRVCMIAYTLYDGDARIRREAETLVSTGAYRVSVLTLKDGKEPRQYVVDGVEIRQLDVEKFRGKNPLKYIWSYVRFTYRAFFAVTRLAMRKAVDVVHVHNMPNFLIVAAIVPMLQRKTVVLDIHDTMPETFSATFSPAYRRICLPILEMEERICGALADRIITVNHVQQEAILGRQPRARPKTIVSMNVPDPRLFGAGGPAAVRGRFSDRFNLVYHGTVSGRLGVDLAVDAVARCRSAIPEIQLHIIGDGDAKERLIRTCEERDFGDLVRFHDRVPFQQLIPVIRSMDLGLVPLDSNPATDLMLPVKLMECLSVGIPVVAPRLRAIEYYFSEDMLFLFEPGDVGSMCDAVQRARDPEERNRRARNARGFLTRYDWNSHKASLLELYRAS